jgi:hypothetical protein
VDVTFSGFLNFEDAGVLGVYPRDEVTLRY